LTTRRRAGQPAFTVGVLYPGPARPCRRFRPATRGDL